MSKIDLGKAVAVAIAAGAAQAAADPGNKMTTGEVPAVVKAAQEAAKPVVAEAQAKIDHLTNQEPWYRSRVTLGALAAMAAGVAGLAGFSFSAEDQAFAVDTAVKAIELGSAAMALIGGAVAWYGRWRAKKPLGQ